MKLTKQGVRDLNPPKNGRVNNLTKYDKCVARDNHGFLSRNGISCRQCGFREDPPEDDLPWYY